MEKLRLEMQVHFEQRRRRRGKKYNVLKKKKKKRRSLSTVCVKNKVCLRFLERQTKQLQNWEKKERTGQQHCPSKKRSSRLATKTVRKQIYLVGVVWLFGQRQLFNSIATQVHKLDQMCIMKGGGKLRLLCASAVHQLLHLLLSHVSQNHLYSCCPSSYGHVW